MLVPEIRSLIPTAVVGVARPWEIARRKPPDGREAAPARHGLAPEALPEALDGLVGAADETRAAGLAISIIEPGHRTTMNFDEQKIVRPERAFEALNSAT